MNITCILGLGTYPIRKPVHGGQRRVTAFKDFYDRHKIAYTYSCVYNGAHYGALEVGPYDSTLAATKTEPWLANLVGDVLSGQQGATDPDTFQHFSQIVDRLGPDALQLEQPFMWPLAKRLRQVSGSGRKLRLIYSSHNVETPLKRAILLSCGVDQDLRTRICSEIEEMEVQIAREADLIVCVSESDAQYYRLKLRSSSPVVVVKNGTDRPRMFASDIRPDGLSRFENRPFLMTVGSAHIPNIDGLCHYVVKDGIFCVPPVPSVAICGGIGTSIYNRLEYQSYQVANSRRVQFFADLSDPELAAIKQSCHGVFLPIREGGGTNLKTAEALALGKWVVATVNALRGFETFLDAPGVVIADTPWDFRKAMRQVLRCLPLELDTASRAARDALFWDRCFDDSSLPKVFDDGLLQRNVLQEKPCLNVG